VTRPRIRTVKPEMWQDEKVGGLSKEARLLLVGLITMADDEGRLRAMPAAILGHVFPYDPDAARKLDGWLQEIDGTRVIVRYVVDSKPYIAFRHWRRHQRINRATGSELPPSPDPVITADNAVPDSRNGHGSITEQDVSTHDKPRADSLRAA
jgi:hypothetical protein